MHELRKLLPSAAFATVVAAAPAFAAGDGMEAQNEATSTVRDAAEVVERMKSDPSLDNLLEESEGVFIVPSLVQGAFIVGAQGGDGVLISRQSGEWGDPAFYTLGSVSIGAQGGGTEGPLAMILMSDQAVDRFRSDDDFSISAEAGLTLVDYSASTQAEFDNSDIVVWSQAEGAFIGASIRATDIGVNEEANHAYYEAGTTPQDILSGRIEHSGDSRLQQALQQ